MSTYKCMFNVHKNQQSWQTGSRNLMGPKTVTEKNDTKNILDRRTDRGKTVYPPSPSGSEGIIIQFKSYLPDILLK